VIVLSPLEVRRAEVRLLRSLVMTTHLDKYGVSQLGIISAVFAMPATRPVYLRIKDHPNSELPEADSYIIK
jgi:hypothetical protein